MKRITYSAVFAFAFGACADRPAQRSVANQTPAPIIAPSLQHMAAAALDGRSGRSAPTFGAPVPAEIARHETAPTRVLVGTSAGAPLREVVKIGAMSERVKIATKPKRTKIGSKGLERERVRVWSKADHEALAATSPRVRINAKSGPVKIGAKRERVKIGSKRDRERIGAKNERTKIATQPRPPLGTPPSPDAGSAPNTGSAAR